MQSVQAQRSFLTSLGAEDRQCGLTQHGLTTTVAQRTRNYRSVLVSKFDPNGQCQRKTFGDEANSALLLANGAGRNQDRRDTDRPHQPGVLEFPLDLELTMNALQSSAWRSTSKRCSLLLCLLNHSPSSYLLRSIFVLPATTTTTSTSRSLHSQKKRPEEPLRVDRILSNAGLGSRTAVQSLIKAKRIKMQPPNSGSAPTVVLSSSAVVSLDCSFFLDGKKCLSRLPLLLAFHKPVGVLSAVGSDSLARRTLSEFLPASVQERPNTGTGEDTVFKIDSFHPVGRLDFDTSGLLLFSRCVVARRVGGQGCTTVVVLFDCLILFLSPTKQSLNDVLLSLLSCINTPTPPPFTHTHTHTHTHTSNGMLTKKLLHPTYNVEKVYVAEVEGTVDETSLRKKLSAGVSTAMGVHIGDLIASRSLAQHHEQGGSKVTSEVTVAVAEGKHRMVGIPTCKRARFILVSFCFVLLNHFKRSLPRSPPSPPGSKNAVQQRLPLREAQTHQVRQY